MMVDLYIANQQQKEKQITSESHNVSWPAGYMVHVCQSNTLIIFNHKPIKNYKKNTFPNKNITKILYKWLSKMLQNAQTAGNKIHMMCHRLLYLNQCKKHTTFMCYTNKAKQ